jgi:hypothetical protein
MVEILQGEIAADPNSNKGHLLKLNNDLYLYDKKETIILPYQLNLKCIHQILQKIIIVYGPDSFYCFNIAFNKRCKQIGLF